MNALAIVGIVSVALGAGLAATMLLTGFLRGRKKSSESPLHLCPFPSPATCSAGQSWTCLDCGTIYEHRCDEGGIRFGHTYRRIQNVARETAA
jgi:hypothetical protein